MSKVKLDEIGYWSEVKLDIIREYAVAYSTIMHKQTSIRNYYYIDGFAGAGVHISKSTQEFVLGSPLNALNVRPPFSGFYFIDLNGDKTGLLKDFSKDKSNVKVYNGDCNHILLDKIFPQVKYQNYERALCLLDPYGLHLNWDVLNTAGQSNAIEIFLNFPVMDMNMNILWNNPDKVDDAQIDRMNAFWGDESWRDAAYKTQQGLFDTLEEKSSNLAIAKAFQKRLKDVAGFSYVPEPIPMRNTKGATVYYLFFASPKEVAGKIVRNIFDKYKNKGLI
ncbi:MAG: three-Cys-motif partner protein TcmP [Phycisphaerae bacterium]|jgi:three-Cys-motif partner protein